MKITKMAIGCDHAGFPYKAAIIEMLEAKGIEVSNFGTDNLDSVDYPDFIHPVATMVESGEAQLGVILCGSGNGVNMTANKHQGVRSALCWQNDIAKLARLHNDANIIALPVRFVAKELAMEMVEHFVTTEFEGGRHGRRVDKIACQ